MIDRITKGDATALIRQWFKPGWTVIDVGAGDGDTVQACLDAVGTSGTVHALEPDARHHADLKRFAGAAKVYHVAAGEKNGRILFYQAPLPAMSSRYRGCVEYMETRPSTETTVFMRRLEGMLERAPDGIKIDTQGSECAVLDGAQAWLPSVRALIVEAWPVGLRAAGRSIDELYVQLFEAGLPPRWPRTDDLVALEDLPLLETRCKFSNWVCRR